MSAEVIESGSVVSGCGYRYWELHVDGAYVVSTVSEETAQQLELIARRLNDRAALVAAGEALAAAARGDRYHRSCTCGDCFPKHEALAEWERVSGSSGKGPT